MRIQQKNFCHAVLIATIMAPMSVFSMEELTKDPNPLKSPRTTLQQNTSIKDLNLDTKESIPVIPLKKTPSNHIAQNTTTSSGWEQFKNWVFNKLTFCQDLFTEEGQILIRDVEQDLEDGHLDGKDRQGNKIDYTGHLIQGAEKAVLNQAKNVVNYNNTNTQ